LSGPYMRRIPVGASAAMVFSLVVALIVTPWTAVRLLEPSAQDHAAEDLMTRPYRRVSTRSVSCSDDAVIDLGRTHDRRLRREASGRRQARNDRRRSQMQATRPPALCDAQLVSDKSRVAAASPPRGVPTPAQEFTKQGISRVTTQPVINPDESRRGLYGGAAEVCRRSS